MKQQILSIAALLLGSAFLLFAGGINALILPVRGVQEGFPVLWLGLIGAAWAIGYILGCVLVPHLVVRAGHVRSFSVMAALAAFAVLASLLLINPSAWLVLRAISGLAFSGAAMIVESWLNERTETAIRGSVFGIYTMVNLAATTAGQMVLGLGERAGHTWFVVAGMFYVLALVPTAVSSSVSPLPLVRSSLDLAELWRTSPVAVVTAFCIGIANNAFATLAAVYAADTGFALGEVALFASVPILAGALAQVPMGMLSDRVGRRAVLAGVALLAFLSDLVFVLAPPRDLAPLLSAAALFGAAIYTMYPVIVAHAGDAAAPGNYVRTSGGLLMLFGAGAIFGPLVAGLLMQLAGASGLFMTTALAHLGIAAFGAWRMTRYAPGIDTAKAPFIMVPIPRTTTPQTLVLAPTYGEAEANGAPEQNDGGAS